MLPSFELVFHAIKVSWIKQRTQVVLNTSCFLHVVIVVAIHRNQLAVTRQRLSNPLQHVACAFVLVIQRVLCWIVFPLAGRFALDDIAKVNAMRDLATSQFLKQSFNRLLGLIRAMRTTECDKSCPLHLLLLFQKRCFMVKLSLARSNTQAKTYKNYFAVVVMTDCFGALNDPA